ncbi:MAG: molybdopterin-dependent oxidoreductase [Egibacteraceae bacterium]
MDISVADPTRASVTSPPPRRLTAALAGVLAAAAALATGELAAGVARVFVSPVEAVAESIIDLAPGPVERFAVETFGSDNKLVLVAGTLVIAALLGAVLGMAARRRPLVGVAGLAVLGVLGVGATLFRGGEVLAAVPSVMAALGGAIALLALLRAAPGPAAASEEGASGGGGLGRAGAGSRRSFLILAGSVAAATAASAAGGRALATRFTAASSRAVVTVPSAAQSLSPISDGVSFGIDGVAPFVTPFDQFYRVDTALTIPQVPVEGWTLSVGGMVVDRLDLSYDDLLDRELVDADITLSCVSNTVGGDLVGHARWTGVRLADLLDEAGVDPAADQVVGRSVDRYTCGFPVEAAYDRDTLVAVGMNGEPLPIERGFPARLVTPGLYGYVSATKWLSAIELTTFDAFDQYWVPRGWDEQAPVKTMARIDVPRSLERIPPGETDIAGVAWAQTRGIEQVEVRIDDGDWVSAELAEASGADAWRQWRLRWDATPGPHRISVRATDGTGELQTEERAEPFPNGASGWMTLRITVDGG